MKLPEYAPCLVIFFGMLVCIVVSGLFSVPVLLVSLGTAAVVYSIKPSLIWATLAGTSALVTMTGLMKYKEGFNVNTPARDIAGTIRKMNLNKDEGFMSHVYQNITKAGYNTPGFGMAGPLVEGFEDEKKEKSAPVKELPAPFKLGEIPSQVKNGPHIDAGATLIKAIQGLNPDQINAMTKDTQQLIETQKSLMGMLGTMKPMMNDGKELMETFNQMFGQ